jgi:beta-glucosidase
VGAEDPFLWGAAVSSHQVEGDNHRNDWWDWELEPGRIADGTTSGDAAAWWGGRAEEDLSRAADLGLNAIRMSLEWSRLEPEPGRFDPAAFDRYRAILDHARSRGLSVVLTLHHFTLPRWVAKLGGFVHENVPALFEGYAERAARELGDRPALWATLNEPSVLAWMAYGGDRWPPGKKSLRACFTALSRMLESHALAYRAIHRVIDRARVGIVLNLPYFVPARPGSALDRFVCRAQDWGFNGAVVEALKSGVLPAPISLTRKRIAHLDASLDWIGLNYYGRYDVRFDLRSAALLFGKHVQEGSIKKGEVDWGAPDPDGMIEQLRRLSVFERPLYVTENGICDEADVLRPRFLRDHALALERERQNLDVRGYFHWALVDNFEWAEGWSARFGLFALDRRTQERTPRKSAGVYRALRSELDARWQRA